MFTEEYVELELGDCFIRANVEMHDGRAIGASQVFLTTDYTAEIYVHPSDLTNHTLTLLYKAAERQHENYLLSDEA